MTDEPENLNLVSPCVIDQDWDGSIFAELEASFTNPSLRYHAIGKYMFNSCYYKDIIAAARLSSVTYRENVVRIETVNKMKVFDLMTGGDDSGEYVNQTSCSEDQVDQGSVKKPTREEKVNAVKAKLEEYNDSNLKYEDIAMPEISVLVYFGNSDSAKDTAVKAKMKMKRVIRLDFHTRIHHCLRHQLICLSDIITLLEIMLMKRTILLLKNISCILIKRYNEDTIKNTKFNIFFVRMPTSLIVQIDIQTSSS